MFRKSYNGIQCIAEATLPHEAGRFNMHSELVPRGSSTARDTYGVGIRRFALFVPWFE